jgi:DNA-binding MarR family transcriptional regulator
VLKGKTRVTGDSRAALAKLIVASLPKFGHWTISFRDFETPYGRVGYRQAGILWVLRYELIPPAEVTPLRLAEYFLVQPSVITGALAKLEAAGLISRTVDPQDSRCHRIAITEKGRLLSAYVETFFVNEVCETLEGLDVRDLAGLKRSVEVLDRIADTLLRRRVEKLTRRGLRGGRDHGSASDEAE